MVLKATSPDSFVRLVRLTDISSERSVTVAGMANGEPVSCCTLTLIRPVKAGFVFSGRSTGTATCCACRTSVWANERRPARRASVFRGKNGRLRRKFRTPVGATLTHTLHPTGAMCQLVRIAAGGSLLGLLVSHGYHRIMPCWRE